MIFFFKFNFICTLKLLFSSSTVSLNISDISFVDLFRNLCYDDKQKFLKLMKHRIIAAKNIPKELILLNYRKLVYI